MGSRRMVLGVVGLTATAAMLMAWAVSAAVPEKINYQGRLADSVTGLPLAGPHTLILRICDAPSGGSILWWETAVVEADSEGVFATTLGGVNPVGLAFDAPYWLEIEVDGETLLPRREMVSVPYAFVANEADHASGADSLEGYVSSDFAGAVHEHDDRYYTESEMSTADGAVNQVGDPVDWTRLKGVPAGFADGQDDVGAGDGYSLDAVDGDPADAVYVNEAGDVGIGTAAPERKLHIKGTGPRILIEGETANPEVNLKNTGDASNKVWAIYKHTPTGDLRIFQGGDRVTFEDITGYVGIGVDDPLEELHVRGTGPTYLYAEAPEGYASGVTLGVAGNTKWTMLYHPGDTQLAFMQAGAGNRMVLTDNGLVGIGVQPSAGILHVHSISPATAIYGHSGIAGSPSFGGGIGVKGLFSSDAVYGVGVMGEADVGGASISEAVGVLGKTNAGQGYGVLSEGGLGATGPMTSIVRTEIYGWRELYGVSSAENWFEDFGHGRLVDGAATVHIDPVFADAADLGGSYHVFLTPLGDCGLYVTEKTRAYFTVKAIGGQPAGVDFDYRIVGKRRGYEDKRLESAESAAALIRQVSEAKAEPGK